MGRIYSVKKAKKDNSVVSKGEPYFYMIFRMGATPTRKFGSARKVLFKNYPTPSQRTFNAYKSTIRDLVSSVTSESFYRDSFEDSVQTIVDELREIADTAQQSYDNMPSHLAESSASGELLRDRFETAEQNIEAIESIEMEDLTPSERLDEIVSNIDEVG
jgi:hypothetical protein